MEKELVKTKWVIDPMHSQIGFKVKHLVVSNVRGTFKEFDASIDAADKDFADAEIELRIKTASIDTGEEKRDAHLRSADFFDAEKYPEIIFKAETLADFRKAGKSKLNGELTMRGIKKPVMLDVEFGGLVKDPWGNEKAVFTIDGKFNRKDWGLNWNAALETGGLLVSEEVWITAELQLAKQV